MLAIPACPYQGSLYDMSFNEHMCALVGLAFLVCKSLAWCMRREVYLQLVILLYSAGEYHAALKLLECSLDLLNQQDPDLLETFRGKLQLLVAEHRGDSGEA